MKGAAVVAVVVCALAHAESVHACSCGDPTLGFVVFPEPGARDVPANTLIWLDSIAMQSGARFNASIVLRPSGSATPIEFTTTTITASVKEVNVLHPAAPLQPGAYVVLVNDAQVTEFEVADSLDDIPPTPPREIGRQSNASIPGPWNLCGDSYYVSFDLEGDGLIHLLDINESERIDDALVTGDAADISAGPLLAGRTACETTWPEAGALTHGNMRFASFDIAGNFSDWSEPFGVTTPLIGCGCSGNASTDFVSFIALCFMLRWLAGTCGRRRRVTVD
jgi:hypothetical protein